MSSERVDLTVTNARVVTPSGTVRGGVAAEDGEIVAVGSDRTLPSAEREIDADGNYLVPGFIDPHVHFGLRAIAGDPDTYQDRYKEKLAEDFETETRGAIHGGVTSVVNFALHLKEPYMPHMDDLLAAGEENSFVDFSYHAMLVGGEAQEAEIDEVAAAGVKSFKMMFNMYKYTAPELPFHETEVDKLYRVLKKVADVENGLVMVHAENDDLIHEKQPEVEATGRNDLRAWAEASPNIGEAMQIEKLGMVTEYLDSQSYVVHLSTAEGVDACERHQANGTRLAAETIPAFLCHNYEDEEIGNWGKISPPVRGPRSQKRLWEGIQTGVVDYVGTDHAPYTYEFKNNVGVEGVESGRYGDMWSTPVGDRNGTEYMLPSMMSEGVNRNRISMERCVEVCSTNNAKRFGLYPEKGVIAEGSDADLVVVDMEKSALVDDDFYHTGEPRYSSFHGKELTGLPTHTIVDGEVVVEDGELLASPGGGEFIAR